MVARPFFCRLVLRSGDVEKRSSQFGKAKQKKRDNMLSYFKHKGLTVQDLPKAILCHELMGIVILALTWSSCYYFPPSQNKFLKEPISRMLALVPTAVAGSVQSNAFLSSRLGTSYIESACLRKILRPVLLPSKLYLTYKMVQMVPDLPLLGHCEPALPAPSTGLEGQTAITMDNNKVDTTIQSGLMSSIKLRGGATRSAERPACLPSGEWDYRSYLNDCLIKPASGGLHSGVQQDGGSFDRLSRKIQRDVAAVPRYSTTVGWDCVP